mmetsp:Transcript_33289/g.80284  ORF Transcript_33289/g.80284 Transcript_33289/m.80284 type:complete len:326 (-) Transcript_33289:488-1465(-)
MILMGDCRGLLLALLLALGCLLFLLLFFLLLILVVVGLFRIIVRRIVRIIRGRLRRLLPEGLGLGIRLVIAGVLLRAQTKERLEQGGVHVKFLILLVDHGLSPCLLFRQDHKLHVSVLIKAHIAVADSVDPEHHLPDLSSPHLESQLRLHNPLQRGDLLEVHGNLVSAVGKVDPPLFELGLGKMRSVHRTHGLALLQVFPCQCDRDRHNIGLRDLRFPLRLSLHCHIHQRSVVGEGPDVHQLIVGHLGKTRALLVNRCIRSQEGLNLLLRDLLSDFRRKMRNLEQRGALDVQGLHQRSSEIQEGHSATKPLMHRRDLHHARGDPH